MRIVFFLLVIGLNLNAQQKGYIEYHYNSYFAIDYRTLCILEFNIDKSRFVVLKSDESPKELIINSDNNNLELLVPESDIRPEFFVDRSTNSLLSIKRMFKKNNILKEEVPKIDWKIKEDFKKISTLNCQKAIGYFRGRTYTVWFSNDIPVPYGPWKLQGLPGLILEAKDDRDEIFYNATKISFTDVSKIQLPRADKAIPLKEFISVIMPKKMEELSALFNSRNTDRHTTVSPFKLNRNTQKELIYEWEVEEIKNK